VGVLRVLLQRGVDAHRDGNAGEEVTEYWKAVEAVTGYPIADLPDFVADSLPATLSRPETFTGTMPINPADSSAPVNWIQASDPWCVAILRIDDATNTVVGGGYVNGRVRTQGDTVTIPLVTAEGYLDRRQTGAYAPPATDQNTIMWQLVSQFVATASTAGLNGMPITLNTVGAAGVARDRTYAVADRKTVLSNLTELNNVQGGPEFTITWRHLTSPERWLPVFNVGTRIGQPVTTGLGPAVTFELGGTIQGGTVVDFAYTEDFSDTKGANYVTAYSLPDATTGLPLSQSMAYTVNARQLELDYTWNPSTSITTAADLLAHVQQQLPLMQAGARSLALSIQGNAFPQFGVDFFLGDSVGYRIGGLDQFGKDTVPALPGGFSGVARVIGVQRQQPDSPNPITTPILGAL
jgi:hypothetical protein